MIDFADVSKIFATGTAGLSDISLHIDPGEFVFLVGPTGSGKTTLLRLLIREMMPTKGIITIGGLDVAKLPESKIPYLRKKVGVIFQDLKLLMDRTILENTLLPLQVAGVGIEEARKRAEELLFQVGVWDHKDKFPVQLSGGELQRVAIARALALSPDILLADEPTGNLDEQTAFEIVKLLSEINTSGTTIIMATHNMEIVKKLSKRIVGLEKGKMVKDERKDSKGSKESKGTNETKEAEETKEKQEEKHTERHEKDHKS